MSNPATVASSLTKAQHRLHKPARLQARLTQEDQETLAYAARLEGRTLSDFVLSHAREAAERTIQEQRTLHLSARDAEIFAEALLTPWEPSEELREKVRRMHELLDPHRFRDTHVRGSEVAVRGGKDRLRQRRVQKHTLPFGF